MASNTKYFSLRGKVIIMARALDGSRGAGRFVLNAPKFDLAIESSEEVVQESMSGQDLDDLVYYGAKSVKVSASLSSFDIDNLVDPFYSTKTTNASGSASAEEFPDDLVAGNLVKLDHDRVSSVVLTDSTGTPVTLTEGTHYSIFSAFNGLVEILSTSGLTQPIKAAYSHAETYSLAMFANTPAEVGIIFDGIDAVKGTPFGFELYRMQFSPVKSLPLINEKGVATLDLDGRALYDSTRAADPTFGPFGRLVMKGAS